MGDGGSTEREYLIASQKGIKEANRGGPEGTRDTKNANKVYSPADRRERYVRTFPTPRGRLFCCHGD